MCRNNPASLLHCRRDFPITVSFIYSRACLFSAPISCGWSPPIDINYFYKRGIAGLWGGELVCQRIQTTGVLTTPPTGNNMLQYPDSATTGYPITAFHRSPFLRWPPYLYKRLALTHPAEEKNSRQNSKINWTWWQQS